MALSGNFNTTKYTTQSSGSIGLNLAWTGTQSVANNTTTISWTLKSNGTMSSGYSVVGGPITVVIGGKTVLSITSRINVNGGGAFKRTGTVVITHNEDGTKSCPMSVKAALYSSSVNCTGSYTYTLNKIDRYALISTADNFTDEVGTDGYPSLVYTNPAGTALVTGLKARILWNSRANATSWVTLNDEGGTYTFTSSTLTSTNINSMLSACSTSNTLPIEFDLQSTLNGTDYHSYKSATMSVVNANPTSGAVTYADTDSTTIGKTGSNQIIVQGQSVMQITSAVSTAKKSATIVSYSLNFNNTTTDITSSRTAIISKPDYAGVYTATVTTTDSRGNTSTASTNIVIYELVAPSAIYSLKRVDNFYTNTTLYVSGQISSINGTNTLTIQERHKKVSDSSWSSYANVPNATNTTLSLDNAYEWEVEIVVSDEYSSTTYTASVGVGLPIVFFDKKRHSMGINGFPDADNQLYVNGAIKSTGDIATSGRVTCSKMSTTNTDVSFTRSSGSWTFNTGEYTRSGNVVQMRLGFKGGGSSVSAGSNSIAGTISGAPLPAYTVRLFGYYSSTVLMGELTSTGAFNVRILGAALNLSTANTATLSGTYIVED